MAVDAVGGDHPLTGGAFQRGFRDVFAGTICSSLSIAYCLSYAALIFSGPLTNWLSYGVALTFLSAAVAAAVVAWRSSFPFAIAGPDTSTAAVTATLVAAMVERLVAAGSGHLLEPTLIVVGLATLATGLVLCVLGFTRAGRAVRYVPYPVIGGFLGATGWLMISGAFQVITDQRLTLDIIIGVASSTLAAKLAAGSAVAIAMLVLLSRSQNAFILPGVLLAAMVTTYLLLPLTGSSIEQVRNEGWLFQPQPVAQLMSPWQLAALREFPWTALLWLSGDLVAVMFVTTISLLLNTTGVEIATQREADIERELKALGWASLATAALGGYTSCLSLSRTTLNHAVGGTGRLSGLTVAAISAVVLFIDPAFLGYVPKFALGGLLLFAGVSLFHRWLIRSFRQLLLIEYLSLVAIALIIINWGFIAGVFIGVFIGCATFALSASRVNAIKFSFDGSEYRSSLDRSPDELALLARFGHEIQGMALQSYLFFGSANWLYENIKELLEKHHRCRFLVFDFRLVTGIDSSATHSFEQIKQAAVDHGTQLVFVNLTSELERSFGAIRFMSEDTIIARDLDRALEACEQATIEAHHTGSGDTRSLQAWLTEALGSAEHAKVLADRCRRIDVQSGDVIARQGDAADSMHFILEGRVGIIIGLDDARSMRVRSLGRHTTIGEMGLITRRPRSATVLAEASSVLYELRLDVYEQIKSEHPALSDAILSYVITVLAERLSFANRVIGVLQR